jgi:hypothetical protein
MPKLNGLSRCITSPPALAAAYSDHQQSAPVLSRQIAKAWSDGSPPESFSPVEDDQNSSAEELETNTTESTLGTELQSEGSSPEFHHDFSYKAQKVIVLTMCMHSIVLCTPVPVTNGMHPDPCVHYRRQCRFRAARESGQSSALFPVKSSPRTAKSRARLIFLDQDNPML